MVMIAGFVRTTIMLVAICAFGVTGVVDKIVVREDYLLVQTQHPIACAWGGFVVARQGIPEWILRHEYGHLLQEEKYGYLHEVLVVIPSLLSALISQSSEIHQARWFEIEATELGRR